MDKKRAEQLLRRYLDGRCTPEERHLVESWYHELLSDEKQGNRTAVDEEQLKDNVWKSIRKRRTVILPRVVAAAATLLVLATGVYFYRQKASLHPEKTMVLTENPVIQPGGNRAMLTLADGTAINLDEDKEGVVIGAHIAYLDGSSIKSLEQTDRQRLAIATPRGGQYRIVLPDGTNVWLNAATTLEFEWQPGGDERVVTLNGEAYFDVSSRQSRGTEKAVFRVKTRRQEVTVLGTGFNVSAYEESPQTVTTLVQGRVRVADLHPGRNGRSDGTWVLEPGFQAVTTAQHTRTSVANLASAVGWKNGDFVFDGSSIQEIMQQLSRWYDIDIQYRGSIPTEAFGGKIARKKDITDVLRVLELTGGVTFAIENRTVIVNP